MAQSSDRNDSDSNDETCSVQVDQNLDRIIEHADGTEEPVSGAKPINSDADQTEISNNEAQSNSNPTHQSEVVEVDTDADFKNIEKRASELASRLGGAGLSYSAGVKKHLEPSPESVKQDKPLIEAVIHQDDLDVDSNLFGVSEVEGSAADQIAADDQEIDRQEYDVSEWNAELKHDQSMEAAPVVEIIEAPVDEFADDMVAKPVDVQQSFTEQDIIQNHNSELQDIENNIESLSNSMKNESEEAVKLITDLPSDQPESQQSSEIETIEEIDQRVSSLEKYIVQLMDDVAKSEQKMGDKIADIVRTETPNAVNDSLKITNVFGEMKAELANAAQQRHLQDVRMSDSLDALHDAMKDIGDRVKAIENGGVADTQSTEMGIPASGKILSSVIGASLIESDKDQANPRSDEKQEVATDDVDVPPLRDAEEIPAWLSDTTQDLHGEQLDVPIEAADVFAPNSEPERATATKPLVKESSVAIEDLDNTQDAMETSNIQASAEMEPELQAEIEPGIEENLTDVEVEMIDHTNEAAPIGHASSTTKEPAEPNDFLRSARAAARAANERSRASELEKETSQASSLKQKSSNFIAAAKRKESGVEPEPIGDSATSSPKNSLFSDKVQGPNSLLVFTSLVLFGTSALLLYGMSRGSTEKSNIVELNAVEKTTGQNPSGLGQASNGGQKSKASSNKKATRGIGGSSQLKTDFAVANVEIPTNNDQSDTLTVHDKMATSHIDAMKDGPSAIRYTGALDGEKQGLSAGSLFDQYSSFSTLSGTTGLTSGAASQNTNEFNIPTKNTGAAVLLDSASGGNAKAQYEVARRYGKGIGVQKSPAISVEWYEKSAKAGYAPAIYRLATMYERGNGVAKDYKRAMKLYITAAKMGNVKAMHNLAVLYTGGNLGKADYSKAIFWYQKAAHYGVKDSQFNLAIIYQNGMAGSLDLEKAFKWYSLAARAGDEEAKMMVMDLRKELSGKQQKKLDKKLRSWKAKTPDKTTNAVSQYRKASVLKPLDNRT